MRKLEDIPKADIFKVPDGYFDSLPGIIQSRVAKKEKDWAFTFQYLVKYAIPLLAISIGAIWYFYNGSAPSDPQALLASISATDLTEYIQESDLSTEDLLESIDYSQINSDSLEFYDSNIPLSEIDLKEFGTDLETEL